ncbi:MAG: hypothetical protein JWO95_2731 [Verrucomicrobiales bacterium]|nr:hypothetical protein [Verrucomicrobiales bacterium]
MNSSLRALCLCCALVVSTHGATKLDYSDVSRPEFFPIMTWDPQHGWAKPFTNNPVNGLEAIAECNFNVAGFVFPKDLAKCKKLGLGGILLPVENDFTNFEYFRNWSKMSDAEIDGRIKRLVHDAGSNPAFKGIFVVDEPHVREFAGLAKAVAAVKKYAPGKLAYINLFPDYATLGAPDQSQLGTQSYTEYLERFVNEVHPQAISYDNYMVEFSDDLKNSGTAASYYRNLLEVRRVAQKYHLPFLNIVTSNQIRPNTPIPSPQNLLFHAYTTLAAGYRGVTWYTFYSRGYYYAPIDNDGNRTLTYEYLKEVNRQVATLAPILCRLESTGVFFTKPAPVEGLPLLPGKLIASISSATPIMVGEFSSPNGDAYAMIVNLSLEHTAQLKITANTGKNLSLVSAVDRSKSAYDNKHGLFLNAGQGMLLKID